ncbi:MAG: hypothetical protein PHE70_03260 [Tepidanaerobacteraceae bacterium]|nr:hypothetical protein [Tepidanaerobacteraceae bacterium]
MRVPRHRDSEKFSSEQTLLLAMMEIKNSLITGEITHLFGLNYLTRC